MLRISPRLATGLLLATFLLTIPANVYSQEPGPGPTKGRYPEIKTWHEQALSLATSDAERLDIFRETLRRGRYSGGPRLLRMFNNFEPPFNFDLRTSGISKTLRLLASDNKNVGKGAARTLRYAGVINGDARFDLTGVNVPISTSSGKTDADIEFKHRGTSTSIRMEVKELNAESQRRNLKALERQFRKMAEDARQNGKKPVWVNRRKNIPEVEALGRKYRVPVYGDVATGKEALKPGQPSLSKVLDDLERRAIMPRALLSGGSQLGFGLYQFASSGWQVLGDLNSLIDADPSNDVSYAHVGRDVSSATAGGLFAVAGGTQIARLFGNTSRLDGLSRWSSGLGVLALFAESGFAFLEYKNGDITGRELAHSWISAGTGAALGAGGAAIGAYVGAAIGAPFGPVAMSIGGGLGALAGGYGGNWFGRTIVYSWIESFFTVNTPASFTLKDQVQEAARVNFIYAHYGVR